MFPYIVSLSVEYFESEHLLVPVPLSLTNATQFNWFGF